MNAGDLLTPSLRLVRELGRGGMGSVWVAEHLALHTDVVVKLMRAELAADEDARRRFQAEAAAAAQVKSPHVVQVLDHGVTPTGELYIVMEKLEGSDLGDLLDAKRRLPLALVDTIVGQVAQALEVAHDRGIVHRDVKPDNVFLCAGYGDGVFVKVLDFGVAKRSVLESAANETRTGALLGTPYYMSPEQVVDAKRVDRRCDVWALGVIAFEALTGRRPFAGETVGELAIAISHAPIPIPSRIDPSLPPAFDGWFARACARDVTARFATVREAASALHALASGRATYATDATLPLNAHLASHPPPARTPAVPGVTAPPLATDAPRERSSAWIPIGGAAVLLLLGASLFVYSRVGRGDDAAMVPPASATTSVASVAPSASTVPSAPASAVASESAPPPASEAGAPTNARTARPTPSVKPAASFDRNAIE